MRERGQPPLSVRIGINVGEVVVRSIQTGDGQTEYTPIGHSTSLASRLQTLAAPGSTAITEAVRKLVEGYFALKSLGLARIKGVWRYQILLRSPHRAALRKAVEAVMVGKKFKGVDVAIDVDPINIL